MRHPAKRSCFWDRQKPDSGGAGVSVDDQRANEAPTELITKHQPGRAGPDDEHVNIRRDGQFRTPSSTGFSCVSLICYSSGCRTC
ncbi:MAG: hypothetical protein ACRD9S_25330 [Pyrinomonadaceae bacterium]